MLKKKSLITCKAQIKTIFFFKKHILNPHVYISYDFIRYICIYNIIRIAYCMILTTMRKVIIKKMNKSYLNKVGFRIKNIMWVKKQNS